MRTAPFGAFLQVEPGIDLVHIFHLSRQRVEKTEDVVKPGDGRSKRYFLSIPKINGWAYPLKKLCQNYQKQSLKKIIEEAPKASKAAPKAKKQDKTVNPDEKHEETLDVTLADLFANVLDNVKENSEDVKEKAKC